MLLGSFAFQQQAARALTLFVLVTIGSNLFSGAVHCMLQFTASRLLVARHWGKAVL